MKKILKRIGLAILAIIILIISYGIYGTFINPISPRDTVKYEKDGLTLIVDYSRPYKKERLIFGPKEDDALVPYGIYWRLGANYSTTFETNKAINFAGLPLPAGKYKLYAVPNSDHWVVSLNSEHDTFGFSEPNYEKDIISVNIATAKLMNPIEQFTIDFVGGIHALSLRFRWDTTAVSIPID